MEREAESRAPEKDADDCGYEPGALPADGRGKEEEQRRRTGKGEEDDEYDRPGVRVEDVAELARPRLQDKLRHRLDAVLSMAGGKLEIVSGVGERRIKLEGALVVHDCLA